MSARLGKSAISVTRLAGLLQGWTEETGSLHRRLALAIRQLVESGELPEGTRLPAERAMAVSLAVSRSTVVAAYDDLRSEGWLASRRGSGTWARRPGIDYPAPESRAGALGLGRSGAVPAPLTGAHLPNPPDTVDLSTGALPGLPMVAEIAATLGAADYAGLLDHHGYFVGGLPELRVALAGQLAGRGVPAVAEDVIVTSGSQQAVDMLAQGLLQPGDEIVLEEPTYRGALEAFRARGAKVLSVPVRTGRRGPGGVDIEVLERLLESRRPKLLYLLPTAHNPTGATLGLADRLRVVRAAAATGVAVVDDGSTVDTSLSWPPPAPLAAVAAEHGVPATVFSVGSLSKLFWGGLRVGWVHGPSELITRLSRVKNAADLGSSVPSQLLGLKLLPHSDHARRLRMGQLSAGLAAAEQAAREHLPGWEFARPLGGAALWLRAPGRDSVALAARARKHGVLVVPGPAYSAAEGLREWLRVGYSVSPERVREGIRRLATAAE
ncbi:MULTISPECIES: PLP-dependent aminotransferase family protein [unclassified Crossiella]|uniref:aminotransferase-like domain-containing protein n=1 Tax=unclassified Crossiella TaxID=2620835 RepID=UPI001FFE73EA|nr:MULTISPECIES: PLP-dependent aminotransferase family protein [unclassified Crossiella]MCK2242297.1 PLP-dependent aminotransferase family protein [Crossiella sp. S99.2]MCK2254672.1 PLP-dependent aminotransferase family protein [Crossiella sp. S99.1]